MLTRRSVFVLGAGVAAVFSRRLSWEKSYLTGDPMRSEEEMSSALKAWRGAVFFGPFHGVPHPPVPIRWQHEALCDFMFGRPMRIPSGRRAGHTTFMAVLENVAKECEGVSPEWWCRENETLDRGMIEECEADFGVNPDAPPWPDA